MSDWQRLENNTRAADMDAGLEARLADPLWMLGRQWQVGEFCGEDAASPVLVQADTASVRLQCFGALPEDDTAERLIPVPADCPLECAVEAEKPEPKFADIVDAGLHFLRLLDFTGAGELRVQFRSAFALPAPADDSGEEGAEVSLLRRRSLDAVQLYRKRKSLGVAKARLPDGSEIPPTYQQAVIRARDLWVKWYEARFADHQNVDCWRPQRMEYAFRLSTASGKKAVKLEAGDYHGDLDWHCFDVVLDDPDARSISRETVTAIPMPVSYRGMPAPRWWSFEDGDIHFGGIDIGGSDMAKLIVAEFATVYSNDWFVVPVKASAGSLVRVEKLQVVDTFGERHQVDSIAAKDGKASAGKRMWRFMEMDGDSSGEQGRAPWLLVPATSIACTNGPAIEKVTFIRDEMANMAWAIEGLVEGDIGTVDRAQQWARERAAAESVAGHENATDEWRYELSTSVPAYWIPFVVERVGSGANASTILRRARMEQWDLLDRSIVGAKGRLLEPHMPLTVFEEEIPACGFEITRTYQSARHSDGTLALWIGRNKRIGRTHAASALEFDKITGGDVSGSNPEAPE